MSTGDRVPLSQLRSRLKGLEVIDPHLLEQLSADSRIGAQRLAQRYERRYRKEQRDRERLFVFERELWNRGFTRVAGIDEAGRGPLAGPVVAAAVVFSVGSYISGVDDSKRVSAHKRERLYEEILATALSVNVGIVDEREIDRTDIATATFTAMNTAIDQLSERPQYILVDGREIPDCPYRQKAIIGGDRKSFSIAAASIVAKVTRDRIMRAHDRQYPEYGFAQHKGYATLKHREALKKYGPCHVHRRSFSWSGTS
jgi:ribonuclease HII